MAKDSLLFHRAWTVLHLTAAWLAISVVLAHAASAIYHFRRGW